VGPVEGLEYLNADAGYGVIVADMNMPEMDGSTFLERAREISPRSVRMMLTGNADLETAIRAVNQGSVFRFICKPCPTEELEVFLNDGLRQYALEGAEQRATALAEASRAKSNFLATVSHELRTPLAGVRSSAEILRNFSDQMECESRAEFLDTILEQSNRLDNLVTQLLLMAEIDMGLLRGAQEVVSLAELVRAAVADHGDTPVIHCWIQDDLSCHGDGALLRRVIDVLLSNASKFTPDGDSITLTLERREARAVMSVTDRGPGIQRETVFEAFVQQDDVLVDKPTGLGLGLPIAKSIIDLHEGSIEYSNTPDGGTTFVVELPLARGVEA